MHAVSLLFYPGGRIYSLCEGWRKEGKISFLTDDALKSEAYHLEITPRQIIVKASDTKGFFYALQTIRQLLPASIEGTAVAETADWSVPAMTIKDEPRFGYRGLMVDVARFFIPKENLLRIIDCMGMLKLIPCICIWWMIMVGVLK